MTTQSTPLLIYQTEDGRIRIAAQVQADTLWLTQQQMALLFQTTQQNISLHLQKVYDKGELQPEATHMDFLLVRQEGSRQVSRQTRHYNLNAVLSVGYRVKSAVARRFRIAIAGNQGTRLAVTRSAHRVLIPKPNLLETGLTYVAALDATVGIKIQKTRPDLARPHL